MKADSSDSFANDQIASQQIVNFPDNRLLIDLCGEYDKNLAELEQKLSVQIIRRGNELAVHGASEAVREASAVLNEIYQRLEGGREVDVGHFDRAIRVLDETRQSMQSDVLQSGTLDASVQHRPEIDNKAINPLSEKKNTSTIGFEYFHIDDAAKRQWWSNAAKQPIPKFNKNEALEAYQKLFSAAELERYLGSQFFIK